MIKSFYVGVKGIVKVGDAVLVLKAVRDTEIYWDIPGGRIDDEETLEEALKRELREELPTLGTYTVGDVVHAYRLEKDIVNDHGLVLVFYIVHAEPFEVMLSDEHVGFEWVTKDTLHMIKESDISIASGYYNALTRAFLLG